MNQLQYELSKRGAELIVNSDLADLEMPWLRGMVLKHSLPHSHLVRLVSLEVDG